MHLIRWLLIYLLLSDVRPLVSAAQSAALLNFTQSFLFKTLYRVRTKKLRHPFRSTRNLLQKKNALLILNVKNEGEKIKTLKKNSFHLSTALSFWKSGFFLILTTFWNFWQVTTRKWPCFTIRLKQSVAEIYEIRT